MTYQVETQASIMEVKDGGWKYSVDAMIPELGEKMFRFISWNKKQGPPPATGTEVMATMQPYRRSPYWINKGDIPEGDVDGTEPGYMLDYNMTAVRPYAGPSPGGQTHDTSGPANAPLSATQGAPTAKGGVQRGVAMHAVSRMAAAGMWFENFDSLMKAGGAFNDAVDLMELIARGNYNDDWLPLDRGADEPPDSPLVKAAQEMGAVVVEVADYSKVENKTQLRDYTLNKGWKSGDISRVLTEAGYSSSGAYLSTDGNTVTGLAELLSTSLDAAVTDFPW